MVKYEKNVGVFSEIGKMKIKWGEEKEMTKESIFIVLGGILQFSFFLS